MEQTKNNQPISDETLSHVQEMLERKSFTRLIEQCESLQAALIPFLLVIKNRDYLGYIEDKTRMGLYSDSFAEQAIKFWDEFSDSFNNIIPQLAEGEGE